MGILMIHIIGKMCLMLVKMALERMLSLSRRSKGILFMVVDQSIPFSNQGPFDIVLHKLSGKKWRRVLEAIQQLQNHQSMLQGVVDLNCQASMVDIPKQLVIKKDASFPFVVDKARLRLPIGGVLFKVYVDGEAIKVFRRFPLPDISISELSRITKVYRFPKVFYASAVVDQADLDPHVVGQFSQIF